MYSHISNKAKTSDNDYLQDNIKLNQRQLEGHKIQTNNI